MRVLSCKINCPSICFSKPSLHLHSPCPLKLEDVQNNNLTSLPPAVNVVEEKSSEENINEKAQKPEFRDVKIEVSLKSNLKKQPGLGSTEVGKGRVKWMDLVGKELVEIREFEPIESGEDDEDGEGKQSCACVIQ